jgi:hypothetical protein
LCFYHFFFIRLSFERLKSFITHSVSRSYARDPSRFVTRSVSISYQKTLLECKQWAGRWERESSLECSNQVSQRKQEEGCIRL